MHKALVGVVLLAWAAAAQAADCRNVAGNFILASDLAAVAPAFAKAPPDAVFAFAPRPGVERTVTPAELARFAGTFAIQAQFAPLCFARLAALPDAEAAAAAMRASLGNPEARIEIVEMSRFPAPPGRMAFPRTSLVEPRGGNPAVWNGYVEYEGGRFPIWARARIAVPVTRLVATVDLRAGQLLGEKDVRLDATEDFPRRAAPLVAAADAVGRLARRQITAGSPIAASDLAEPNAVERGQTVAVEVRSGPARIKLDAIAEAAGHLGDTIPLRNTASGKLFRARIEDKGRAVVECPDPEEAQ